MQDLKPGKIYKSMLDIKILIVFSSLLIIACSQSGKKRLSNGSTHPESFGKDSLIRNCISNSDTTLDSENSLNYIVVDTFYTVKLTIEGRDTILDYQFDCSTPTGLVPSLHSYYKGKFCLIMGNAFDYREFIVAYKDNDRINIKKYETGVFVDLNKNLVVYRNYSQRNKITIENFISNKTRMEEIPSSYNNQNIVSSKADGNKLRLLFNDGRELDISIQSSK